MRTPGPTQGGDLASDQEVGGRAGPDPESPALICDVVRGLRGGGRGAYSLRLGCFWCWTQVWSLGSREVCLLPFAHEAVHLTIRDCTSAESSSPF